MQIRYLTIGVLLGTLPWSAYATTLEEAMNIAEKSHPELSMSILDNKAAQAQLTSQSAYNYNPELSLEYQDRKDNAGVHGTDYYIGLSQGIEIAGKQGYREQAAQAGLQLSENYTESLRQQLSIGAARAFVQLFLAKQALKVRMQQGKSLKVLSLAVKRQMDVGDANVLDANLAQSAYTTALSAVIEAKQNYALAQAQYNAAVGSVGHFETEVVLPRLKVDWRVPNNLLDIAINHRPEIAILSAKQRQSNAQAELADAERYSDPTISLMGGREAGEDLVKLGISFALPLSNNRKGAYQASLAQELRSEQALDWFKRRLKFEVQAAAQNHAYAMLALKDAHDMKQSLSTKSSESLAEAAFKAGEISLEDLVIHINQALEARLTTLNFIKQSWFARIRLAEVLGQPELIIQGIQK